MGVGSRCESRRDDCVSLDLDQHRLVDQTRDFDHAGRRANSPERLTVRFADVLPVTDIGDVQARPNHIFESRADAGQRGPEVLQCLHRLRVWIADADHLPRRVRGRRPGYPDELSDAHGTRVADDRLPARARTVGLTLQLG